MNRNAGDFDNIYIGIVGLGYVGLPLALAFGAVYKTIGFDINPDVISCLKRKQDPAREIPPGEFAKAPFVEFTSDPSDLGDCDVIIVAVPTPIDSAHQPDLGPLKKASGIVGRHMKKGAVVVYESTVFPGATEEVCVPILEISSGMKWRSDFHVGYSPERINPGDAVHTLANIVKVVSADDMPTREFLARLYGSIIPAGIHVTGTIKEAEAAKVIENTQRDLNIALMNELAVIFDRIGLDTRNVLDAACTKWNFLPFTPGLVGGHCIGVDPYYLTHKAELAGYHPEVILAGRRINDSMGRFVAQKAVKLICKAGTGVNNARVAVLGLTFKEECADLRNTRVVDIIEELSSFGIDPLVHDPLADPEVAKKLYGITLSDFDDITGIDAMIIAVAHRFYRELPSATYIERLSPGGCVLDVKSILDPDAFRNAGIHFWRL